MGLWTYGHSGKDYGVAKQSYIKNYNLLQSYRKNLFKVFKRYDLNKAFGYDKKPLNPHTYTFKRGFFAVFFNLVMMNANDNVVKQRLWNAN